MFNFSVSEFEYVQHALPVSGLKWYKVTSTWNSMLSNNTELVNAKLAENLQKKLEFTREEWENFGITNLNSKHFVKSNGMYFKPVEPGPIKIEKEDKNKFIIREVEQQANVSTSGSTSQDSPSTPNRDKPPRSPPRTSVSSKYPRIR